MIINWKIATLQAPAEPALYSADAFISMQQVFQIQPAYTSQFSLTQFGLTLRFEAVRDKFNTESLGSTLPPAWRRAAVKRDHSLIKYEDFFSSQ